MKEIYAYEFNFIINVVLPLVAFLGGFVYANYCLYINEQREEARERARERARKVIATLRRQRADEKWKNTMEAIKEVK